MAALIFSAMGLRISSPMWATAPKVLPMSANALVIPGKSEVERDRADGASDVSGQRAAILSFRGLANPLEEIAIASVHTRLPCDLEQTHRPRVTFRMRPMADSRYPFFLFAVLFHHCLRGCIEVIW